MENTVNILKIGIPKLPREIFGYHRKHFKLSTQSINLTLCNLLCKWKNYNEKIISQQFCFEMSKRPNLAPCYSAMLSSIQIIGKILLVKIIAITCIVI
jgi:hypothetical protein